MACSKYTLTNTGSTTVNFSYRRCDDSLWEYQVELTPAQTKNIWVINGTYTIAPLYQSMVSLINQGAFPPVNATATPTATPTSTPTPSLTQTQTPTNTSTTTLTATPTSTQTPTQTQTQTPTNTSTSTSTPTPSVTATITPSPTEPARFAQVNICHDEADDQGACDCLGVANVWTDGVDFASSTIAFSDANGPNTGNPDGWYVQGGILYYVAVDCGVGCTTGSTITSYGPCGVTPTPTATNTSTPTNTPTQTPTPTRSKVAFTVYSGTTSDQACGRYNPTITVYGNNSQFDLSTQFSNISTGNATIDMTGFIQNGGYVSQLDTNGNVVGSVTICQTLTPTPTVTPTNTQTPTTTPTTTPTRTFYQYSLGTGLTANDACVDFGSAPNTIYGTVSGGPGPNIGEYLYYNSSLTTPVANGYYSNGTAVFNVTGGLGQITSVDPTGC